MRGILCRRFLVASVTRITPAHAGNTKYSAHNTAVGWDHPRACGEYLMPPRIGGGARGSPPRMRGILCRRFLVASVTRITPAHAGNTQPVRPGETSSGDHPRACGEYPNFHKNSTRLLGSPPRMRGIHTHHQKNWRRPWITPAHAGNTIPLVG